jgi:hypothetical protein
LFLGKNWLITLCQSLFPRNKKDRTWRPVPVLLPRKKNRNWTLRQHDRRALISESGHTGVPDLENVGFYLFY